MILGYQRSGTSALGISFSKDADHEFYPESKYSLLMKDWLLRPEKEIRSLLNRKKKIVTKPISESYIRTTAELFEEYHGYDLRYILIVRNIENIYFSNNEHDKEYYDNDINKFIELYNQRMKKTLKGLEKQDGVVIQYEELINSPKLYEHVCKYLDINGEFVFRKDSNLGKKKLNEDELDIIQAGTKNIKKQLDQLVEASKKRIGFN